MDVAHFTHGGWQYAPFLNQFNNRCRKTGKEIVMVSTGYRSSSSGGHGIAFYEVTVPSDGVVPKDGCFTISPKAMKKVILAYIKKNENILSVLRWIDVSINFKGFTKEMMYETYPDVPDRWIDDTRQQIKMYWNDLELNKRDFVAIQLLIDEQDKS